MCLPLLGQIEEAPEPPSRGSRARPEDLELALATWWEDVVRRVGQHAAFGVFLGLPTDTEALRYLASFRKELGLMSAEHCAILVFRDPEVVPGPLTDWLWRTVIAGHFQKGRALNLAAFYEVEFTKFPCFLVFRGVKDPAHVVISFAGMSTKQIAETMRSVLTKIRDAHLKGRDPLRALTPDAGQKFISQIRNLAGRTFEVALSTVVQQMMKPGP